ncbi:uncharacterized protein [Arachis hypogaea]|uniref:uncharacterized protein n=1 Tax=Arachis hypogaea TaxID=3818 RepID=UPI000DEC2579|nr:transcription initiation factor IIF subunit alpha [Arachis hypogaea]XP_025694012.1 transcription initiation factor IIF subunit alpha [Arachis hypogaea]XP_025694013.1 transcription initiation factor IIF subunit alpha [Arachis hypogaea]
MTENSNIEAAGMSASTQPSSPPSGVRKNRSAVWDHFDVENAIEKMKLQDFLSANCGREQKSSGKDVHGTASKSNASAKGSAPPLPSSSSSKAGTSTAASGPVSEEEIRAVLKQKTRVTTQHLVAKFKARLRCKEDKYAFAEILKRISKIQRNPTSNRPSYVILRDK